MVSSFGLLGPGRSLEEMSDQMNSLEPNGDFM